MAILDLPVSIFSDQWCHSEEPEATRNLAPGLRFLTEPVLSTAEGFEMTIMESGAEGLSTGFGFWIEGRRHEDEILDSMFRFQLRQSEILPQAQDGV